MKCLNPRTIEPKKINGIVTENRTYAVPCSRCSECKKQRVKDWTFRLFHEERVSKSSYFVTLTYDTQFVNFSSDGQMTLSKKYYYAKPKKGRQLPATKRYGLRTKLKWVEQDDLTKFLYKLRRYDRISFKNSIDYTSMLDYPGIRYYACGEYGEEKHRPHYHLILFNVWDPTNIGKAWKVGNVGIESEPKAGAFAYCAKYLDKEKRVPFYEGDDRRPEYSVMSQGLGQAYLTEEAKRWHRSDPINNNFVTYPGRKDKQRMPRYYYEQLYDKATREGLSQYWEVESLIQEHETEKEAQKRNMTLYEYLESKKHYIDLKFHKSLKPRTQWQKSINLKLSK